MSTPPADALLDIIPAEKVAILARLYDRFAQALDPFSEERDQAERVFQQEVLDLTTDFIVQSQISRFSRKASFSDVGGTCELLTSRQQFELARTITRFSSFALEFRASDQCSNSKRTKLRVDPFA